MRILDIDLDFFVNEIAIFKDDKGERLDSKHYKPWKPQDVEIYLKNNCNIKKPIEGTIIKHHNGAFYFWKKLIQERKLRAPFEVVHIDAHSDTGLGDGGYMHIMRDLLHIDVKKRPDSINEDKLGCGNYISFAMACRWISKIIFIVHPKGEYSDKQSDMMPYHLKDFKLDSGFFQLKKFNKSDLDNIGSICDKKPLSLEPEIPFELIKCYKYKEQKTFDFIILSKSPGYTPKTSDKLIPVIQKFMK